MKREYGEKKSLFILLNILSNILNRVRTQTSFNYQSSELNKINCTALNVRYLIEFKKQNQQMPK